MADPVIDTLVLEACYRIDEESLTAIAILHSVLRRHVLAMDAEGEIRKEYLRHIKPNTQVEKWWQLMLRTRGKFASHSSHLRKECRDHLLHKLGFDTADIKFVGVASKTESRYLIAEESDYTREVKDYLASELKTKVVDLGEGADCLR